MVAVPIERLQHHGELVRLEDFRAAAQHVDGVGGLEAFGKASAAVLVPLFLVGVLLGPYALGGLLGGALLSAVLLALLMANAGGAWDNAKKYVEQGNLGGKGSPTHSACIVGDTVGDPFKDTSGPSLNILIKVLAISSLVMAPFI